MDNILIHRDIDLVGTYEKEDFNTLLEYIKDNNYLLSRKIYEGDNNELEKSLRSGGAILRRFERYVVNDDKIKAIFELGKLYGRLDEAHENIGRQKQKEWIKEKCLNINKIPYLKEVMLFLEDRMFATKDLIIVGTEIDENQFTDLINSTNIDLYIDDYDGTYRLSDLGIECAKYFLKEGWKQDKNAAVICDN